MSVLSPILIPPEVKEYMTKGERFIKWDDVSIVAFMLTLHVLLPWKQLKLPERAWENVVFWFFKKYITSVENLGFAPG